MDLTVLLDNSLLGRTCTPIMGSRKETTLMMTILKRM